MSIVSNGTTSPLSPAREQLNGVFEALQVQDLNLGGQIVEHGNVPLAMGHTSDVFRAWSTSHQKFVAVKRIRFFLLDNMSSAGNLGRELRLWSRLVHPNVLPLLGHYLEGPKAIPNLISEWMKNGTVMDYMKVRTFNADEIRGMVLQVASGLDYIHTQHEMIHADLKGSNILVSDDGRLLLADFGLAISSSSRSLGPTTYHGEKGSLRWMAKELHSDYSSRNPPELPKHTKMTDIWSFGMVILELLTGELPYAHIATDRHVVLAIVRGELPEEPHPVSGSSSLDELWTVARECWSDPEDRPSASHIVSWLEQRSAEGSPALLPFPMWLDKVSRTHKKSVSIRPLINVSVFKFSSYQNEVYRRFYIPPRFYVPPLTS